MKVAFLALSVVAAFGFQEQILRCRFEDGRQINQLESLNIDVQGVLNTEGKLDVRTQRTSDYDAIKSILSDCETVVEDLDEVCAKAFHENNELRAKYADQMYNVSSGTSFPAWFNAYHTLEEIQQWYQSLATTYPNWVRTISLPSATYQGRTIHGISVFDYSTGRTPTIAMWHTAGQHAREWVSSPTMQFVAYNLLNLYSLGNDTVVNNAMQNVVHYFFGPINPDGYAYTWSTASGARNWRKNRNPFNSSCTGTDQNRNWPDHWGGSGSSANPCDDTYRGRSASSELETTALINYWNGIINRNVRITLAIDWHSYSQLFLRPYGWTNTNSPDEARFVTLGNNYVAAVRSAFGLTYTSQKSIDLYITTGTASDWYYGASNPTNNNTFTRRTAGWTVELRPTGSNPGFVLPAAQITPTGYENWLGYRTLVQSIYATPLP